MNWMRYSHSHTWDVVSPGSGKVHYDGVLDGFLLMMMHATKGASWVFVRRPRS